MEWGVFRGEGQEKSYTMDVGLGEHGHHTPLPTLPGAPELNRVFREGVSVLQAREPLEMATAFFLFGALQQFFLAIRISLWTRHAAKRHDGYAEVRLRSPTPPLPAETETPRNGDCGGADRAACQGPHPARRRAGIAP